MNEDGPPLIVTALLDAGSFALFDRLRREHFPAPLNHLTAHLTLFHHLPGDALGDVAEALRGLAAATPLLPFRAEAVRMLGRGAAFDIACADLVALRRKVAARWSDRLTAQDRAGFRPHVTVQNKATPEAARALRPRLEALLPVEGRIEGLALYLYRGGPWEAAGRFPFVAPSGAGAKPR